MLLTVDCVDYVLLTVDCVDYVDADCVCVHCVHCVHCAQCLLTVLADYVEVDCDYTVVLTVLIWEKLLV